MNTKQLILVALAITAMGCARGKRGYTGATGAPGTPGSSCSASNTVNGAVITCTDGTTAVISNGAIGETGPQGPAGEDGEDLAPGAYDVTEVVDPCGDSPGFDEVLLRLNNGRILAHYAGGGNLQFLTLLSPGTYTTTDQVACTFTVGAAPEYTVTF